MYHHFTIHVIDTYAYTLFAGNTMVVPTALQCPLRNKLQATERYITLNSWYLFCIQQLPDTLSTGTTRC